MATERYVAINDHHINDTAEFIKKGTTREFGKDGTGGNPHFTKIPQGIREGKELNKFVDEKNKEYSAALRKKMQGRANGKISVAVPENIT